MTGTGRGGCSGRSCKWKKWKSTQKSCRSKILTQEKATTRQKAEQRVRRGGGALAASRNGRKGGYRSLKGANLSGKTDSIHHRLLEGTFETANVPELRQKLLYTTPSGWWWWYRIGLPTQAPAGSGIERARCWHPVAHSGNEVHFE